MNYVEIVNDVSAPIRFEADYMQKGQVIENITPYFQQNVIKRIEIPYDAKSINVAVWVKLPDGKERQFYSDAFAKSEQRCYVAKGTSASATCSKVSCRSIPSTDYVQVTNKSEEPIYVEAIYVIGQEAYKDTTSPIKKDRLGILLVPRNAGKVQFKIYMLDETWDAIFFKSYKHPFKVCFEVSGTVKKPTVKEVPCSLGDNNQNCNCCCCHCCCCRCCPCCSRYNYNK